ncbi:MAG TPA: hypothetical protein VFT10_07350 [Solirubrobacterales bacterium]|nr:hypothetical protein [Solirubrobacterales bacterium]
MSGRVILVSAVAAAQGARAAAAALACAGSEPDRPGLLIDIGGRAPRPTLVASSGARELEERLTAHLPRLRAASRGQTCHLAVGSDPEALEDVHAALPLVRDSVAVVHVPPALLQDVLSAPGIDPAGILLRADLSLNRPLTALTVRNLLDRELAVRVLKRSLSWVAARRALFGVLPPDAPGGLPSRTHASLLESEIPAAHACYSSSDDEEADSERTSQRQRRGDAGTGQGRALHRDPKRQARR